MKRFSGATTSILGATTARVISMVIAVFSVPILLQLISRDAYGTWVTLTSFLAWIAMLDLGVGNSLRNSVASLIDTRQRTAVQQEFLAFIHLLAGVGAVATLILIGTLSIFPIFEGHRATALCLYIPILLSLPMLLGASVLQGSRAIGLQSFLQSVNGWLFFLAIAIFHYQDFRPSLDHLAVLWSLFYVAALLTMLLFALRKIDLPFGRLFMPNHVTLPRGRLKVGLSFLVLQLSSLVLYSLGNALIYQNLGPREVARYDIVNKIFQVVLSFYTIMIGVAWSEISRLRAQGAFLQLQALHKKMLSVAGLFSCLAFVIAYQTPWIVDLWTSGKIEVSRSEAMAVATLVSLQATAYVGAVFMNAFEKIRPQIVLACVSIALMIPLSAALLAAGRGIAAVPLAAAALTLLPVLVCNYKATMLFKVNAAPALNGKVDP